MTEHASEADWTAPPGTVKRECPSCTRYFASRDGARKCPTCLTVNGRVRPRSSESPYEAVGIRPARPNRRGW